MSWNRVAQIEIKSNFQSFQRMPCNISRKSQFYKRMIASEKKIAGNPILWTNTFNICFGNATRGGSTSALVLSSETSSDVTEAEAVEDIPIELMAMGVVVINPLWGSWPPPSLLLPGLLEQFKAPYSAGGWCCWSCCCCCCSCWPTWGLYAWNRV